jgi:hypothetical protein
LLNLTPKDNQNTDKDRLEWVRRKLTLGVRARKQEKVKDIVFNAFRDDLLGDVGSVDACCKMYTITVHSLLRV